MVEELRPSKDDLVVRLPGRADAPVSGPRENTLEIVGQIATDDSLWLARATGGEPPREKWVAASRSTGAEVYPVLVDNDGAPHFPTGELTVRFEKAPTADDLAAFSKAQDLTLVRGNEFVPQQFVFRPNAPAEHYLPERVVELATAPGVKSVWPNTISRYHRL